jgi:DNA-binding NarL/FixJ family response regulator
MQEDMDRARELRANLYLVKPVLPEDLLQTVRAIAGYWLISNSGNARL